MKKIYFACSIAGGRDHADIYHKIVSLIKAHSVELLSELFVDKNLVADIGTNPELTPQKIWSRDTSWVKSADGVIADVTQPSLGVGYEIAIAEQNHTPVLALFYEPSKKRLSPMIDGNPSISVVNYSSVPELKPVIEKFISEL